MPAVKSRSRPRLACPARGPRRSRAAIARRRGVSWARGTQIMDQLLAAPVSLREAHLTRGSA